MTTQPRDVDFQLCSRDSASLLAVGSLWTLLSGTLGGLFLMAGPLRKELFLRLPLIVSTESMISLAPLVGGSNGDPRLQQVETRFFNLTRKKQGLGSGSALSNGSGSKQQIKSVKIMANSSKSKKNHKNIMYFYSYIKLLQNGHNNKTYQFWKKYIFDKFLFKLVFSQFQVGSRAGSVIARNGSEDPDPDQNVMDPKH